MVGEFQYIKNNIRQLSESLLDDEEDLINDLDDVTSGFKCGMNYINKGVDKRLIARMIELIMSPKYKQLASKYSEEYMCMSFIHNVKNIYTDHRDTLQDFIKYMHHIFYKYKEDFYEFVNGNDYISVEPKYHKSVNKYDIDDLKRYKFKNYENAIEWVVFSKPFSPGYRYMLKTIKHMDKNDEKFVSNLLKNIK